jgi:hypothetical protein
MYHDRATTSYLFALRVICAKLGLVRRREHGFLKLRNIDAPIGGNPAVESCGPRVEHCGHSNWMASKRIKRMPR